MLKNAGASRTRNSGSAALHGALQAFPSNFLQTTHLLRTLFTLCRPLGTHNLDLNSARVSLTLPWSFHDILLSFSSYRRGLSEELLAAGLLFVNLNTLTFRHILGHHRSFLCPTYFPNWQSFLDAFIRTVLLTPMHFQC